jgi:hypothetical protein
MGMPGSTGHDRQDQQEDDARAAQDQAIIEAWESCERMAHLRQGATRISQRSSADAPAGEMPYFLKILIGAGVVDTKDGRSILFLDAG